MEFPQTKTDIAKMAVTLVVSSRVTDVTADELSKRTSMDPDGLPVRVTSLCVGSYVAQKVKPCTDNLVDQTVDRYKSWRQKRQNKKNPE